MVDDVEVRGQLGYFHATLARTGLADHQISNFDLSIARILRLKLQSDLALATC